MILTETKMDSRLRENDKYENFSQRVIATARKARLAMTVFLKPVA